MYRVPGHSITSMNGNFREVKDWSGHEGFVLTTFSKDSLYVFDQAEEAGQLHLFPSQEICVTEPEYLVEAAMFKQSMAELHIDKAVFSRIKEIPFQKNPQEVFFRLTELYPEALVYLLSSPFFGTWIGATPEVLLSVIGSNATTMALAGTMSANDEGVWGKKELEEQNFVSDYIRDTLRNANMTVVKEELRSEHMAGPVKHLVSHFHFQMDPKQVSALALQLHPTPAVSGLPQNKALQLILESENHDRSLYAGIIGILGAEENQLYVNLRCARLEEGAMHLYLGGGFTSDSDIEKEWQETENKARTLLNVVEEI